MHAHIIPLTFPDNHKGQDREITVNNAAMNTFPPTLSCAAWAITAMTFAQEQTNTPICQNTLLHGKALLIIATCDTEYITLEMK